MATELTHDETAHRFELRIDGELAGYSEYRERDGVRDFDHTVTLPEFRGRGVAGQVTTFALDDTRDAGATVVASCSYVDHFIATHEAYQDLLA